MDSLWLIDYERRQTTIDLNQQRFFCNYVHLAGWFAKRQRFRNCFFLSFFFFFFIKEKAETEIETMSDVLTNRHSASQPASQSAS